MSLKSSLLLYARQCISGRFIANYWRYNKMFTFIKGTWLDLSNAKMFSNYSVVMYNESLCDQPHVWCSHLIFPFMFPWFISYNIKQTLYGQPAWPLSQFALRYNGVLCDISLTSYETGNIKKKNVFRIHDCKGYIILFIY